MMTQMFSWLSGNPGGQRTLTPIRAGERVLVVDDDTHLRELLKIELEDRGYAVELAATGAEALQRVDSFHPGVIILDANMPVLDGLATLTKLRAQRKTRSIPVVMLTTRSHQGDVVAGYRHGAQAYLTKPFLAEEVIENVKRLMRSQA